MLNVTMDMYGPLKTLIDEADSEAASERESLGLYTPSGYFAKMRIMSYENNYATADHSSREIALNLMQMLKAGFGKKELPKDVVDFEIYMNRFADIDFNLLHDENTVTDALLGRESAYDYLRAKTRKKGPNDFFAADALETIINNQEMVKGILDSICDAYRDELYPVLLNTYRHELDHIAFFDSLTYSMYSQAREEFQWLNAQKGLNKEGKEWKLAGTSLLKEMASTLTLLEASGNFYSEVPVGQFGQRIPNDRKERVLSILDDTYIAKVFPLEIADVLFSINSDNPRLDSGTDTHNLVMKVLYGLNDSPKAGEFTYSRGSVDFAQVKRVLFHQLSIMRRMFRRKAREAVRTIGNALGKHPAALMNAHSTLNANAYVQVARRGSDRGYRLPKG